MLHPAFKQTLIEISKIKEIHFLPEYKKEKFDFEFINSLEKNGVIQTLEEGKSKNLRSKKRMRIGTKSIQHFCI